MGLEIQINEDIKNAMLARDKRKLEALRAVKAALLLEKTGAGSTEITQEIELKLLQKLVKQRKESAQIFSTQGRMDLAEEESFQAEVIEKYLPEQLSDDEIKSIIQSIITQTGATSMKEMGMVMGLANKELAGKADSKTISGFVKDCLSQAK